MATPQPPSGGPGRRPRVVVFSSFGRGTGRSTLLAAVATRLAQVHRVAVVDADLSHPSQHTLLGLPSARVGLTLNDALVGLCRPDEAAYELPRSPLAGHLFVVPAGETAEAVSRSLREEAYLSPDTLLGSLDPLAEALALDFLLVDIPSGLTGLTLPVMAASDALVLIMRLETAQYQGVAVTLDVARKLGIRALYTVANMVSGGLVLSEVEAEVARTFQTPSWALPYVAPYSHLAILDEQLQRLCAALAEPL